MNDTWTALLQPAGRPRLAQLLLQYVLPRRWFRAKSRTPSGAEIADLIPLDGHRDPDDARAHAYAANWLALLAITYDAGPGDLYSIPLARADRARAEALRRTTPHAIITPLAGDGAAGGDAMVDGLATGQAAQALLDITLAEREIRGLHGGLRGEAFLDASVLGRPATSGRLAVTVPNVEQTNSTLVFGEHLLLKIYRQVIAGPSPELEVGRFLTAHCDPPCAPRVLGALSYESLGKVWNVGIAHEYLANDGDAWSLAVRELRGYFERASDAVAGGATFLPTDKAAIAALIGRFQALAETLGRRTGQLHLALAGSDNGGVDPLFAPEPLTPGDRVAMVTRAKTMLQETLSTLEGTMDTLGPEAHAIVESLRPGTNARARLTALLRRSLEHPLSVEKTRIHGDLHLGQVLSRGDDFVIIDFEGEPTRPLDERRAKASPLRDVTTMARSFDYAVEAVLREVAAAPERRGPLQPWALLWTREVTAAYTNAYLATVRAASFLPKSAEDLEVLLTFHELEKVIYELAYEINNRPEWLEIPLRGLARLAREPATNEPPGGEAPCMLPNVDPMGDDHAQ